MICEVRSDCQFCDLWLAGFWYCGWVSGGVVMGFVGCRWVWPWVGLKWCGYGFRGLQMGVAMGFRWVLGDVSWVADGCGHGSQVRLEWVTEGSQWLRFCGFFLPPLVVAGSG